MSIRYSTFFKLFNISSLIVIILISGCGSNSSSFTDDQVVDVGGDDSGSSGTGNSFDNTACDYAYSELNEDLSLLSHATWSCDDSERSLIANAIPDHSVGRFPNANNPNAIEEQTVNVIMPVNPDPNELYVNPTFREGIFGYVLNGVSFQGGTGGGCNDEGDCIAVGANQNPDYRWSMEGLGQSVFTFGFDASNAHVQSGGQYHYHGMPEGFIENLNLGTAVTLVGFAADGFPVYARYGYSDPQNSASTVIEIKSSYQTKSTPDEGRPSTEDFPMGSFYQDYEYVEGLGDLDQCNGRFGVTPEFPDGTYHYYVTDDFPRVTRCLVGDI